VYVSVCVCVSVALSKDDSIPEHDPEVSTSCFIVKLKPGEVT